MTKFKDEWYNKGYEDGYSDAVNNIDVKDVLNQLENFSDEEIQEILQAVQNL